ncbi:MAG: DUF1491 family protein [Amphiplicatus sp.]
MQPRLKSEIRVAAHLRRCAAAGAFAQIAKKGDADAGAIAVKIFLGRSDEGPRARLFMESLDERGARGWRDIFNGPCTEEKVDERLRREARIDPDLWVIEIEDREGRGFLDGL